MIQGRAILQIYAAAVCFFTAVAGVISGGGALYSALEAAMPEQFLPGEIYEAHQTDKAFLRWQNSRAANWANRSLPGSRSQIGAKTPPENERDLTALREESFAAAISIHQRNSVQSLIRSLLILFLCALIFYFHRRILRRDSSEYPESNQEKRISELHSEVQSIGARTDALEKWRQQKQSTSASVRGAGEAGVTENCAKTATAELTSDSRGASAPYSHAWPPHLSPESMNERISALEKQVKKMQPRNPPPIASEEIPLPLPSSDDASRAAIKASDSAMHNDLRPAYEQFVYRHVGNYHTASGYANMGLARLSFTVEKDVYGMSVSELQQTQRRLLKGGDLNMKNRSLHHNMSAALAYLIKFQQERNRAE